MLTWTGGVILAAVVSFVIGAMWYGLLFGEVYAALRPESAGAMTATPAPSVLAMEFTRCLIVAATLAYLICRMGIVTLPDAMIVAVIVWGGLQCVGLIGSVMHEGYPLRLYAIHMGDALAKSVASSLIIVGLTSWFA